MKLTAIIFLTVLLLVPLQSEAIAEGKTVSLEYGSGRDSIDSSVDSVMALVIANSIKYRNLLESYEADIYIKGRMQIEKKNYLIRYANNLFPVNRRENDMVFEMMSSSKFESPNTFHHHYKAINGSSIPNRQKQMEILRFLNLNIYYSTAFDDAILMPTSRGAAKYYNYRFNSTDCDSTGSRTYLIDFFPKSLSQKLIRGTIHVSDSIWTITKMDLSGQYYFSDFDMSITFGKDFEHFNLPETADLTLKYSMLGNVVVSSYHSRYSYKSVIRGWDKINANIRTESSYDLSHYYSSSSDSIPIIADSDFWKNVRDEALSPEEVQLYDNSARQKEERQNVRDSVKPPNRYLKFAELMVSDISTDYKDTYIRYYGVLNPSELGYSATDGITFRQRMRIRKDFANYTKLGFTPAVGLATKRKEIFVKAVGTWEYKPERIAALTLTAANSNQSYSTGMINDIKKQLEALSINTDNLDLQYFQHYYAEIKNQIEIFNGFMLRTSAVYNYRRPVKRRLNIDIDKGGKVEIVNTDYNDLTTSLGFSFTPRSFYRIDKRQKKFMYSRYPTISVELTKAFPGIWNSLGNYSKIEVDINQSLQMGLLQKLNYRLSAGMYMSKKSSYFADFKYFARSNFPDTWDDQLGGVFNLLKREWFYASDKYVQLHLMYGSPFIALHFFEKNAPKYVFTERLYLSTLWTPALPSYTELGYGIGNHIFDIALFAGFSKLSYQDIGLKFAFVIR